MAFDLHVHTTYSLHAYETPAEAVRLAVEKGLEGIAITDHDTVEGIEEAMQEAKNYPGFQVIPGGEFSFNYKDIDGEILAYFINPKSVHLLRPIAVNLRATQKRDEKIAKKLGHSHSFTVEDVKDYVKDTRKRNLICRNDIIYFMMDNGITKIKDFKKAFDKYVGKKSPHYIPKKRKGIRKIITCIKQAGGTPIFAHIGIIDENPENLEEIAAIAIQEGIDGFDIYNYTNKGYSDEETETLNDFCSKLNIKPSRLVQKHKGKLVDGSKGSDCHFRLGDAEIGSWICDIDVVNALKSKSKTSRRKFAKKQKGF
ncbi:PHP domain-containing protein [Candidatus Woesearchaeota archaeon]|nr:PHP domain-containing protein [Candidatus Woesearchaeota archaeon]